jgi:hypothetical protein
LRGAELVPHITAVTDEHKERDLWIHRAVIVGIKLQWSSQTRASAWGPRCHRGDRVHVRRDKTRDGFLCTRRGKFLRLQERGLIS